MIRFGIDLGGTKIEIIALAEDGVTLLRKRIATPRGNYDATVNAIAQLVVDAEASDAVQGVAAQGVKGVATQGSVGVAIPGAISAATGLVKNANSICLIDRPLQQDLEQVLQRPVRLSNDANCFALSEASDGAAAGVGSVFGVIVGTGVGGALVINGRVVEGSNRIAGEWGHNSLPWPQADELPGPACYCGRHGCIETFLSGPALADDHQRFGGESLVAGQIADLANHSPGDQRSLAASQTLQRYEDRMARALASVINIVDPEVIVLGGGLSNISRLYENVPARWGNYIFSDTVNTRLVPPMHGDSSGVRGAAWLWPL